MPTSHFASPLQRAVYADGLVTELERVLGRIHDIRCSLTAQHDLKSGKEIDTFTARPVVTLLDRASEPIREARRIAVVEAYDRRKEASGSPAGQLARDN